MTGGRILSVTTRAIGDATSDVPSPVSSASGAPKQSVWTGRAYLIFVAAAYGSLSVAFKYVYSLPVPPAPASSAPFAASSPPSVSSP